MNLLLRDLKCEHFYAKNGNNNNGYNCVFHSSYVLVALIKELSVINFISQSMVNEGLDKN